MIVAWDLRSTLERFGYEVCAIVGTAREAVEQAETACPDLILMDIKLKGDMDGVSAASEIRRRSDVAIIFVSAHVDARMRSRAEPTRPSGFIGKPYAADELKVAIERAYTESRGIN